MMRAHWGVGGMRRPLMMVILVLACGSREPNGAACGEDPEPESTSMCPEVCTGGCTDGVCTVACIGFAACDAKTITCPPDHACVVVCEGGDACDSSSIECPSGYGCEVRCDAGTDACGDLEVECKGASTCTTTCSDTATVCTGAVVTCGSGACIATCAGKSGPEVLCGDACTCTPC